MLGEKKIIDVQKVGDGIISTRHRVFRARTSKGLGINHPMSVASVSEVLQGKPLFNFRSPVTIVEKPVGKVEATEVTHLRFPLPGLLGGKEQAAAMREKASKSAGGLGGFLKSWKKVS